MAKFKNSRNSKSKTKVDGAKLSRNQLRYIEEYGSLPEESIQENRSRVIMEEELDAIDTLDTSHKNIEESFSDEEISMDEIEDDTPYNTLVKSLRKTTKRPEIWLQKDLEEKGQEEEMLLERDETDLVDDNYETDEDSTLDKKNEIQTEDSDSDSDDSPTQDIYTQHFDIDEKSLACRIREVEEGQWKSESVNESITRVHLSSFPQLSMSDTKKQLKSRLVSPFSSKNSTSGEGNKAMFSKFQKILSEPVFNYQDLLFAKRTWKQDEELTNLLALHTLNHCFKTRGKILKNNEKIKKLQSSEEDSSSTEIRDQGYTRPKVLVILPFRHQAKLFIEALISISGCEQQENKKRFKQEFSISKEDDVIDDRKPKSYKETFAGNIDDCFRIALKISRKCLRLYSDFYSSDIIVASPLGLRLITGVAADRKDADFLSSIEVVIVDHADIILMQNWDHLDALVELLNCQPKEFHDADFSRIKHWYLDNRAKYLRQTIVCSSLLTPEINSLFTKFSKNVFGRTKIKPRIDTGTISKISIKLELIFEKIDCNSVGDISNARFNNFVDKIFPSLVKNAASGHICVFVPSYFDFVRVKKYIKKYCEDHPSATAGFISEYTKSSDISRTRSGFFHGKLSILFLSERYFFYKRHRIRGIKHLVFYGPPILGYCYSDMISMLADESEEGLLKLIYGLRSPIYYTKYDYLAIERIVGTEMATSLLANENNQVVIKTD